MARIAALCMVVAGETFGQAYPIFNGTVNTCTGAFLDSGGEGAIGYSNNEDFTYTICPDSPNDAISLTFLTFNLSGAGNAPVDQMTIYDGNSTAATTLGTYGGTALQTVTVLASPLNNTGCLTIVFRSNNAGTGVFAASISCYTPCQRPTAVATMSQADPVKICIGESIVFNGSGSFAAAGFSIASRTWDFGDGTVLTNAAANVSHTYTQAGEFIAQLYVVDDNGCASANRVDLAVQVGTEPTFVGTQGELLGCEGQTLCLDGVVNATTWNALPGNDLGSGVFLPDDVGSCFNSEITFTQFAPGQTLTNVNDLFTICASMEHSFMGDLVVNIISPTGQTVTMHQQGGGATFLGVPVDNDLTPNVQGECWNYCWSPAATNGTWVDNAGGTLPTGTYESLNPLNGLVGSQLNGTWSLQICDLWASDNGFLCNWDIAFNPAIFPDLTEFTPIYGAQCDSSSWSGPNITSTTADCNGICVTPPAPGSYDYVYAVTDDYGCEFDTTLTVTIVPAPVVNAGTDVVSCGTPVPMNATMVSGGLPGPCVYELRLIDTFGDGWNGGANITVTVGGVSTTYTLGDPPGDLLNINIPVQNGQVITLTYQAGTLWNFENSFQLRNAAGGLLYSSGNGPATGVAWSGVAACPVEPFTFVWSPAAGLSNSSIANPTATVATTTEYCVTASQPSSPNCTATDCVTITVDTGVDPGIDGSTTVCADAPAFDLFPLLGGTPTTGGTWTAPSGAAHSGNFAPGADTPGIYTYTVIGSAACGGTPQTATVTVTVSPIANAGTAGALTICATSGGQDLFASLGGTPDPGGMWSGPSPVPGSAFDPATMSPGTYTYTVTGIAPCPSSSATVTVVVNTPPNAITDGFLTLCSTDAAASMFDQLGGPPAAGGAWSGPSPVIGDLFDPVTMIAGNYVYTVAGVAPCPDESATVTVTISTPPDPGANASITLCSSDAPVNLFGILGGTPDVGGAWSGPSALVGGQFDPASMIAGDFVYTVDGLAPCPAENATVAVVVNTPLNAGADGTITLCTSDAAISLFAQLGGTPQAGGTWSGPSPVIGDQFDPGTMLAGNYVYTVTGVTPCPDESATVTVTISTPPDPGANASITLCSSDAPVNLFGIPGGTPDVGGAWSGPSALVGGQFDPASMIAGDYVYTVDGIAPCPAENATVAVVVNTPPNAGADGTITLCTSDAAISLFAQLGGTPQAGGTWSGPSLVIGDQFDPGTMLAGNYVYTVTGVTPCPDESATVTVTISTPPDPGANASITLCSSDAPVNLFGILGGTPDVGGAWSGPSALVGGQFDPASMIAGDFVYTVDGLAPCPAENATVAVVVNTPPNAGADGSITLCTTDAAISLFAQLGGTPQAGGTWSGPSPVIGDQFDPGTMLAGNYVYTVMGVAPCPDVSATVVVTVNTLPDAGSDGSIALCISSPAIAMIDVLVGTPDTGGTWSGPSAVAGGQFQPGTMTAGDYTYTVNGAAPCPSMSSTVTMNVVSEPDAGLPGAITLCTTSTAVDLFAELNGTPDAGGSWSGPSAVVGGLFDPATMNAGVYTYTIDVPPPCSSASSEVTIILVQSPDAGDDGALTLCISSSSTDMLAALSGTPDVGGVWIGPSPVIGGQFDPANMSAGIYTYTVTGLAPCPAEVSELTIAVVAEPDAGMPGSRTLCTTDMPIDLFAELEGTPDAGGTWSGPSALAGGMFDPATMIAGVYTYTIAVPPPCASVSSTVNISLTTPPNAGLDGSLTLCISSPVTSLLPSLGGSPDTGGSWSGPSQLSGGAFDPATMVPGAYSYTVQGSTPCPADVATVTVDVVAAPDAGTPGSISLCATDNAIVLLEELEGSPDGGGSWSGPSALLNGLFDPATMLSGIYTYTISVPPPCVNASSTVDVSVVQPPDAGGNGGLTLCATSDAAALIDGLTGTPAANGTWTGPSAVIAGQFNPATMVVGLYTYTVPGSTPCPAATAQVEVNVVNNPDPGGPGFLTLCATDDPVDLFTMIEGLPDAGGTWTTPDNGAFGGVFDPVTDVPGSYTYTLTVPPPCTSASTTVTVSVVQPPNAGTDAGLTLCISSDGTPLFPLLGGSAQMGGSWSAPDGSPFNGIFDPAINNAGDHVYTVAGTTPCPADLAIVSVGVVTDPDPGIDGTLTLCTSDATIDLFSSLGGTPDPGGSWTTPNGVAFSGLLDPANDLPGVYTYTIDAPPPCSSASSTVSVTIVQPPDAGLDGSLVVCAIGAPADLFNSLGGTPDDNGTWLDPAGNGTTATFDPAIQTAGDHTYIVAGTSPCPAASAIITVSVTEQPNAGNDAILNLCTSGDPVELFPSLGGATPGGVWIGPDGGAFNGTFIPGTSVSGDHVYTVSGAAPCPNASATVTVVQLGDPDAGGDGGLILCSSNAPVDLFDLLTGTPDPGGTWTDPLGNTIAGSFEPSTQSSGVFTYTLIVPAPCVNDTSLVVMTVVQAADPGESVIVESCVNAAPIDLFAALEGTPDSGGNWTGPTGPTNSLFTPGTDVAGTYSYSIIAPSPCPMVGSSVTITIESLPNAGTNGSATLCPDAPAVDLFDLLGGAPDETGTWTGPGGISSTGIFAPGSSAQGTYTYTVLGTLCPNDLATASVTIYAVQAPNAGPDMVSCNLKHTLEATGEWATGIWSMTAGPTLIDANSPNTIAAVETAGAYTFTWSVVTEEGCTTQDDVTIIFTEPMEAIATTADAICHGACDGTAMVSATGGNIGVYSYTWSNGVAGSAPQAVDLCAGTYTVQVADTNGCSVSVPFTIAQPAALQIDGTISVGETCPGSCDGTLTIEGSTGVVFLVNGVAQPTPLFSGLCAGVYSVGMVDANGCTAVSAASIASPPPVIASFTYSPDTLFISDPEVGFINLSSPNAVAFNWTFGAEGSSTLPNPTYTFPHGEGGIYDVCLVAIDQNGCSNEICTQLPILDLLLVYVPNAFTPDGDGINDTFLPVFNLPWVVDYQFLVFNRWGEQIFGTERPGDAWDGSYSGVISQQDVYVWKISCRDQLSGERIERVGHVTVVK